MFFDAANIALFLFSSKFSAINLQKIRKMVDKGVDPFINLEGETREDNKIKVKGMWYDYYGDAQLAKR